MTKDISMRGSLLAAEALIAAAPQRELEVIHHFSPGIYAREMRIPAGTILTGQIHKTEHLCIISAGEIGILDEYTHGLFKAPFTFISKPGVKRMGLAHTDTVFITIHATDKTDLAELESDLVVSTYAEYEQFLLESKVKQESLK